ncbi:MAG TPA: hypothetical protein VGA99_11255 [bacterium]
MALKDFLASKKSKIIKSAMSVEELVTRFPEIPRDLHREPQLAKFAASFGEWLRQAQNPSACSTQYSPGHHYYLKLIGPLKIYMYGLATKEKILQQLQDMLDLHAADPQRFAATLLPDPGNPKL